MAGVYSEWAQPSVDREGCDRGGPSTKPLELLKTGQRLVVFPEGEIYSII